MEDTPSNHSGPVREASFEAGPPAGYVSLDVRDEDTSALFERIAQAGGVTVLPDPELGRISLERGFVRWRQALDLVAREVCAHVRQEGDRLFRVVQLPLCPVELVDVDLELLADLIERQNDLRVLLPPEASGKVNYTVRGCLQAEQLLREMVEPLGYAVVSERTSDDLVLRLVENRP